tara:strand:+ start:129 stop:638 length:510 start_codon:yes stop_codon:yes gene_type:complete
MKIKINKNKENISKLLENNYIILLLVSYSYLIYKIINNSFKEILVYIISIILFYSYFKNLKYSYIFGFFVLLIRITYKELFKIVENFKENKNNKKDEEEINKEMNQMNKTSKKVEKDSTAEPIAKADPELSDKEIEEMEEDENKKNNFINSTEKNVGDDINKTEIDTTI